MGEVFRATDTRLGRTVALKLLPQNLAGDAERLARFEREARVLASLNHPSIAHLYGFETATREGGTAVNLLAMELVEGEDLAQRLARGAIPLDEALDIARQIAEALEEAHEKGIVHRDLKPANIKVTPDGKVKLLDFGLAKAWMGSGSPSASGSDLTQSPTLAQTGTAAGIILGTASYMSPEQARGRPVDKRADIWAFGVVLYEMLTGRRLFHGETVSDVLAAVLKSEPDLEALGDVPPRVRRVLARCLQKDARQRLHDIGDARLELLEKEVAAPLASVAPPPPRGPSSALPWAIAAVALLAAVALGIVAARRGQGRTGVVRLSVLPPAGMRSMGPIELSPDGTRLAFTAAGDDGTARLFWRSLDAIEPKALNGTEGAESPFWSPDSASIGFFAGRKLKRIALAGGPPRELAEAPDHRGGSWGSQGVILFAPEGGAPIYRIPAEGGAPAAVTKLEKNETSHRWPHFLADGKRFLFLSRKPKPPQRLMIEAASLDSGKRTVITESNTSGVLHAGRLFFVRESSLLSQAIDERTLALSGEPRVEAEDAWSSPTEMDGLTAFSIARDGTLAYRRGGNPRFQLVWKDREGKTLGTIGSPNYSANPFLAPDLRRVLFDVSEPVKSSAAVLSMDLETGRQTQLTFSEANDLKALLTPDGRTIVFTSDVAGPFNIFRMDAGGGAPTPLVTGETWMYAESVSPDGKHLAYRQAVPGNKSDIWIVPLSGGGKPAPLVATPANEENAAFSPDGRFLAYDSDASGVREVFVQPFPATGARWQVSIAGGSAPSWAKGSRELFYASADNRLMAVPITAESGSGLTLSTPKPLFTTTALTSASGRQYDVTPDGQRFLLCEPVGLEAASPIVVVLPGR